LEKLARVVGLRSLLWPVTRFVVEAELS